MMARSSRSLLRLVSTISYATSGALPPSFPELTGDTEDGRQKTAGEDGS